MPRAGGSYEWMVFVDGENFTFRGQVVANKGKRALTRGPYWHKDIFLWVPSATAAIQPWTGQHLHLATKPLRAFYYTSVQGDAMRIQEVRESLRSLMFEPVVIQRLRDQRQSKGVDIALAKDMLVNAFHDNYQVAVLYAGDADYVPLIQEVKRMGKVVYLGFFKDQGLADELRLECDSFFDVTEVFLANWGLLQCS